MYRKRYISNTATVTIDHQWEIAYRWFAVDFFGMGLHACTAVARLPLRQLDFLVVIGGDRGLLLGGGQTF